MAFLRSITRCNSFVSKKLHLRSSAEFNAKFSRSELLASHRYYNELQRELNTRFNSSIASSTSGHKPQQKTIQNGKGGPKDPLDVSFNNPHAAFKSKTTGELIRAYVVYLLCSSTYLVDNNLKVRQFSNNYFLQRNQSTKIIITFNVKNYHGKTEIFQFSHII